MSDTPPSSKPPQAAALYIALLQFLFVTTWTVYAIYLPRLLVAAGLPATWAPWVLVVDQLVFMAMDVVCGVAADRVQRTLGRIGPRIVGWTMVSCLAFLLLPHVPLLGGAAPALLLLLTLLWTTTSSALRAPPWVLLGKHAARPALPWLNTLTLMGLAAGGAVAPYLGTVLKNVDPRLPFALSSLTLLLATMGIVWIERALRAAPPPATEPKAVPQVATAGHIAWMVGVLLLAAGFQCHMALNSAAQWQRVAPAAQLEWLLPLFWVGFGVAMMPGSSLCKRYGALPTMAVAAAIGVLAAWAAAQAQSTDALVPAQLVAGGAWGSMLMAMFCAAADLGRSGREGLALGTLFAMLALATLARILALIAGLPKQPDWAALLGWLPVALWAAGAVLVALLALRPPAELRRA